MPEQLKPRRNPKILTSVASGVLLVIGWLIGLAGGPETISFIIYIAAILVGGYYFGREAVEELVFERSIGIELLMSVAAVVATIMGLASEGAMLVFLYSISEAVEGHTEEKTRSAVKALMNLAPQVALGQRNGCEGEIPVEEMSVGDMHIVKPGQSMPTDGEVLVGSSSVGEAPVTGESVPVEKPPGETVFAGSINGEGALEVRAGRALPTTRSAASSRWWKRPRNAREKPARHRAFWSTIQPASPAGWHSHCHRAAAFARRGVDDMD